MPVKRVKRLRRTGRSTADALFFIAKCIQNPKTWFTYYDHAEGLHPSARHFGAKLVHGIIKSLDLSFELKVMGGRDYFRSVHLGLVQTKLGDYRLATIKDLRTLR